MSNRIEISVSRMEAGAPVTVLHVKGQIDASNVADLETKALDLVKSGTGNMLIDLGGVTFMSSAGFRTIHRVYQAMHPAGTKGQHLKLLDPSDEIRRLVKTLGFDKFVGVLSGDLRKAVATF